MVFHSDPNPDPVLARPKRDRKLQIPDSQFQIPDSQTFIILESGIGNLEFVIPKDARTMPGSSH
jgi:hypothetical protein